MNEQNFSIKELAEEIWKPIENYEIVYEISSLGRIKRIAASYAWFEPRFLRPELTRGGYFRASLCVKGKSKRLFVHQLVAEAFIGNRPTGFQINHIDLNKLNNRFENLEYVTPSGNACHARALKFWTHPINEEWKGEKVNTAKLTAADVVKIRNLRAQGASYEILANQFNISKSHCCGIVNRKFWKHVT